MKGYLYQGDTIVGFCEVLTFTIERPPLLTYGNEDWSSPDQYFANIRNVNYIDPLPLDVKDIHVDRMNLRFMFHGEEVTMGKMHVAEKTVYQDNGIQVCDMRVRSDGLSVSILNGLQRAQRRAWQKTQLQEKMAV